MIEEPRDFPALLDSMLQLTACISWWLAATRLDFAEARTLRVLLVFFVHFCSVSKVGPAPVNTTKIFTDTRCCPVIFIIRSRKPGGILCVMILLTWRRQQPSVC